MRSLAVLRGASNPTAIQPETACDGPIRPREPHVTIPGRKALASLEGCERQPTPAPTEAAHGRPAYADRCRGCGRLVWAQPAPNPACGLAKSAAPHQAGLLIPTTASPNQTAGHPWRGVRCAPGDWAVVKDADRMPLRVRVGPCLSPTWSFCGRPLRRTKPCSLTATEVPLTDGLAQRVAHPSTDARCALLARDRLRRQRARATVRPFANRHESRMAHFLPTRCR